MIIGGVAGGMSAATRLRRLDERAEIVVFERSGYVSFANCGLPYYLGEVIKGRHSLFLQTPESLGARFAIDVRVHSDVTSIDRLAQRVHVHNRVTGDDYDESYDYLVLSPGAVPFVPPIPGAEHALTLRNMEDMDALVAAVGKVSSNAEESSSTASAVVMGGGFIGLEVAENLFERRLDVTVVELADQILAPMDSEMADLVAKRLVERGVRVITGAQVTHINDDSVTLSTGETLPAEVVVAAIGVRPESSLARDCGLDISPIGGIIVDDQQRTSDPAIFAVGDAVVKRCAFTGQHVLVPLANPANREGRLAADVIAGRTVSHKPVIGTSVLGVFGITAAATGMNERRARRMGKNIRVIHTHPADHAGYYPGAQSMSLKLVVDADTDAILGAQGVGGNGVDKRIDVIATAIRAGLTATDLGDLELAYAPQYGSAKDPVNMLGFINENIVAGLDETIQWHELDAEVARGVQLIDVRTPGEHRRGAIPDSINIPVDDLRARIDEVADDCIIYCHVGLRGHIATRILRQYGRKVRNLDGGYRTWARI